MPRCPRRQASLSERNAAAHCSRAEEGVRRTVALPVDRSMTGIFKERVNGRAQTWAGRRNMKFGISVLLITHGILAVLLLGAITHQAIAAAWPAAKRAPGFFNSLRSVNGMNYTNAVIILFLLTFALGTIVYPT